MYDVVLSNGQVNKCSINGEREKSDSTNRKKEATKS